MRCRPRSSTGSTRAGNARPEHDVRAELGMVQVLGRLALSFGILAVAGLSGWLAGFLDRATVFLIGLVIPAISVIGVLLIRVRDRGTAADRLAHPRRRPCLRRRRDCARARRGPVRPGGGLRALDGGDLHHAGAGDARARFRDAPRDPVHQHHHFRVSRHALGRRRLFLVDARRAEVRRGVLRHAAPDRRRASVSWRCGCSASS